MDIACGSRVPGTGQSRARASVDGLRARSQWEPAPYGAISDRSSALSWLAPAPSASSLNLR
jgi:hypothetical protein